MLGDSPRGGSLLVCLLPVDCSPLEGLLLGNRAVPGNRSPPGDRVLLGGRATVQRVPLLGSLLKVLLRGG